MYGMELGGQCLQRSFEAGEERLLHQVSPFPFSVPDSLFLNILMKLEEKKIFMRSGYFSHFTSLLEVGTAFSLLRFQKIGLIYSVKW